MKYIITPSGLKQKARKSYLFMKRSFSVVNDLKEIILDFALKQYNGGKRRFLIIGDGELSDITELVLSSARLSDVEIIRAQKRHPFYNGIVVFNTKDITVENNKDTIDIWKEAERLYGSNYEL